MLQAFTWQQFLIAAVVFSLVWLVIVLMVFYRKELGAFLSGGSKPRVEPLTHAWQGDFDNIAEEGVMGKPALSDGVSILDQDDFSFKQGVVKPGNDVPATDELLQSDVFDLMERIKPVLEDAELDKDALIDLVNGQVRDYPKLMQSPLLESVYERVCHQVNESAVLEFELSAEELKENL